MLISISIATATNTIETKKQKGESPLYKIRTKNAIREKIQNIKAKFFADRLFFLPLQLFELQIFKNIRNKDPMGGLQGKTYRDYHTCADCGSITSKNFLTCQCQPLT